MRITLMIIFFFLLNCAAYAQESKTIHQVKETAIALQKYYVNRDTKDSIKNRKLFFAAFPEDFNQFEQMYGYDDKKGAAPLYEHYITHVAFFKTLLASQTRSDYFNRLIQLGSNAHWEADAINALQQCILGHVIAKPALAASKLKQLKPADANSFLMFLFDGPHPGDAQKKAGYNELYKKLMLIDPSVAGQLKLAYDKVVLKNETH